MEQQALREMMINNFEYLKLDLTAKDSEGKTGFQIAQEEGQDD